MQLVFTYLNFVMSYFNWKSDILLSVFSFIPFYCNREIFHEDPNELLFDLVLGSMIWMALTLFLTHLAFVKMGLVFVENHILRGDNERINIFVHLGWPCRTCHHRRSIVDESNYDILYKKAGSGELVQNHEACKFSRIDK